MIRLSATLLTVFAITLGVNVSADENRAGSTQAIRDQSRQTIEAVRDTLRDARKLDRAARERKINDMLRSVIAPLVSTPDTLRDFYEPHWAEIQKLGLVEQAKEATLSLLRDNYLFILERSLDSRIRLLGVSVDGDRATARFRIYAMKSIPIDLELYRVESGEWRVYDAQFLRKSVRDGIHAQMHALIEEQGLQAAIESLTLQNSDQSE